MKRIVLLLVCAVMIGLPLFAGGGGQKGSSQAVDSLTVACLEGWYPAVSINDNLPAWQEMEKKTGIHINWQASSDYNNAMMPLVASGARLPDIMLIPPAWGNSGVYNMARDKMIIPLDDLIAKQGPDIQKILGKYPSLKAALTAPDGKIYSIADTPMFVNDVVVQFAPIIRKDWLDKLGLKAPTTIDEWHTVLVAFRDRDPNGNGIKDEIPFASNGLLGAIHGFGSAFGLPVGPTEWWYDNTGKVFYVYTSPQYRQMLEVMSQWYKEGLLDTDIARNDSSFNSLISTNVVGSIIRFPTEVPMFDGFLKQSGVTNGKHQVLLPPLTRDGSNPKMLKRDPVWSHYGITRDCKNPELAMKWINFVWGSEEGVLINEWGVEGLSFTRDANGQPHFTEFVTKNPSGLSNYNALRSLGASNTILVRTPMEVYFPLNEGVVEIEYEKSVMPYRVEPFPSTIMLSPEEQAIVDRVQPDIQTYSNEVRSKLLIGETPFSAWDSYAQTLNSMGLNDLQKIKQAQYNRGK